MWQSHSTSVWPDFKQTMEARMLFILLILQGYLIAKSSATKQNILFSVRSKLVTPNPTLTTWTMPLAENWASFLSCLLSLLLLIFKWAALFPSIPVHRAGSWFASWFYLQRITLFSSWTLKTGQFLVFWAVFISLGGTSSMQGISHTGLLCFYRRNKITNWRGYSSRGLISFQVWDQIIPFIKKLI